MRASVLILAGGEISRFPRKELAHICDHARRQPRLGYWIWRLPIETQREDPAEGLIELNQSFLRAGVGYQFENGRIIRVDSHRACARRKLRPGSYALDERAHSDAVEQIVLEFDEPQTISRLVYEVEEAIRERTQEVRIALSEDEGRTYRQILVQEYNFSPQGTTYQREEQRQILSGVPLVWPRRSNTRSS